MIKLYNSVLFTWYREQNKKSARWNIILGLDFTKATARHLKGNGPNSNRNQRSCLFWGLTQLLQTNVCEVPEYRLQQVSSTHILTYEHPSICHSMLHNLSSLNSVINNLCEAGSLDSSVGIATGYRLDDWGVGVRVPVGPRIFSSPSRPDRLWGPPNLLSDGYRELFPRGQSSWGVKLTTHLQLMPRSRKCGSIHPPPIRLQGAVLN
jgi:hypothetical protein